MWYEDEIEEIYYKPFYKAKDVYEVESKATLEFAFDIR